jgi:hypothetical protein
MLAPRRWRSIIQTLLANSPCKFYLQILVGVSGATSKPRLGRKLRAGNKGIAIALDPSRRDRGHFVSCNRLFPMGCETKRRRVMVQLYGGKRPIWKGMSEPYESLCGFCPFAPDASGAYLNRFGTSVVGLGCFVIRLRRLFFIAWAVGIEGQQASVFGARSLPMLDRTACARDAIVRPQSINVSFVSPP